MKHKATRITLIIIEAIIGLGAIGGGIAILTGAFDQWLPLAWLQGTPFSNYTIPGFILLILIGGGMLLAAATVFVQREWAVLLSAAMGLVMIGFEVFGVAIIDRNTQALIPSTLMQQALMSGLGLVVFGLASYLWMSEYRERHFLTSPVSHA
ncbi:MAG TPA: hypothetical protein VIX20_02175 [Ktedonobacteraceae bacterium]